MVKGQALYTVKVRDTAKDASDTDMMMLDSIVCLWRSCLFESLTTLWDDKFGSRLALLIYLDSINLH